MLAGCVRVHERPLNLGRSSHVCAQLSQACTVCYEQRVHSLPIFPPSFGEQLAESRVGRRLRAKVLRRRLDIAFRVRRPPHTRLVDPTALWESLHPTALNGASDFQSAARHLRLTELSPDSKPRLQVAADAPAPPLLLVTPSRHRPRPPPSRCVGVTCEPPF